MTKNARKQRFIKIHKDTRLMMKQSQEYMAESLGVSVRTIQNWEKGSTEPSFFQSLEWFRALHVNPFPLYMSIISPYQLNVEPKNMSDSMLDDALIELLGALSPQNKRALLYLFMGKHGSSAYSVMQLMLCHLHLPLKERIFDARSVLYKYKVEERLGTLICTDNIMPDTFNLNEAITKAEDSFKKNEYGYNNIE